MFEGGAIDAWSIWEPYASLVNTRPRVRQGNRLNANLCQFQPWTGQTNRNDLPIISQQIGLFWSVLAESATKRLPCLKQTVVWIRLHSVVIMDISDLAR